MTKKLEQLFNMDDDVENQPSTETNDDELSEGVPVDVSSLQHDLSALDKINNALPAVKGLEASDVEMDDLAGKAIESYENLMDLGMQVESRFSSEIFSVAGQMLNHAITARTAKANKKLKMIELQLKQARLAQQEAKQNTDDIPTGEAQVLDRNELLKAILDKNKKD